MSRTYEMDVVIQEINPKRVNAVKRALNREWEFSGWWVRKSEISTSGVSTLSGGEGEDEFVNRLAQAVWKANRGYCHVEVNAYYLEDLPFETHVRGEADYREHLGKISSADAQVCSGKR